MELFNITRFLIHLLFFSICIIPGEFPKPQVKNGIANISTDYTELFKGIKSLRRNIFFLVFTFGSYEESRSKT